MAGVTKTNYDSYKSDFDAFKTAVNSLSSSKLSAGTIDGFQTKIADVSIGAFNDAVGAAFKTNQTKNKTDIQSISDDISGGGFNTIKTTITSLDSANSEFETARTNKSTAETEKSKLPAQVKTGTKEEWVNASSAQAYASGQTYEKKIVDVYGPNPAIEEKEKEIEGYEKDMQTAVNKINALLGKIAGASFGSSGSSDNPAEGDDSSSGDDSSGGEEKPTETPNETPKAPPRPTRAELEADGTYNSNGGRDGAHYTTYQDYLNHLRRNSPPQLDPNSTEYDILYRASIDGTNTMRTPDIYIAEFYGPPYVIDGVRQGDPVEMWRAEQAQISRDRARLGV